MDYLQYTAAAEKIVNLKDVLNLVINGLPSIPNKGFSEAGAEKVLNLVINGLPSILKLMSLRELLIS